MKINILEIIKIIIPFVLGYITSIYLPLRFRKEGKIPKISISPFQAKYNYFDITNHGGDILNLEVEINWLQVGEKQTRKMLKFSNIEDNLLAGHYHKCNALKKGQTKHILECPSVSDDKKIEVAIKGEDLNGKTYKEFFNLDL